jgi:hypothetical protein
MTITEQIKVLCVRSGISVAELARRVGQTPQSFHGKLKRGRFQVEEMRVIAEAAGCRFVEYFELENGERVE